MFRVTRAAILVGILVLAGCTRLQRGSIPPDVSSTAATPSQVAQQQRVRARRIAKPRQSRGEQAGRRPGFVTGSTLPPPSTAKPYSPEWWAQEKLREQRLHEHLKRVMDICKGC